MARRLSTIPGVVQINSWGGTTKEFEVEVDLNKLEAYQVTLPQLYTALSNANVNVGGREITIGQQSVNIRGIGLINDGGNDDLTQGRKLEDIENVVLAQNNGVPVLVKQVARVYVGHVPRLGSPGAITTTTSWPRSWSWAAPSTPTTSCRRSRTWSRS